MSRSFKNHIQVSIFLALIAVGCVKGAPGVPRENLDPPPTPTPAPTPRPTPSPSSYALGLANRGNTCFANSVHKFLWKMLTPIRDWDTHASLEGSNEMKQGLHDILSHLETNYQDLKGGKKSGFYTNNFFASQSDRFFAAFNDFHENHPDNVARDKNIDPGMPSVVGEDQVDALSYLERLNLYMNLKNVTDAFYLASRTTYISDQVTHVHINSVKGVAERSNLLRIPMNKFKTIQQAVDGFLAVREPLTQIRRHDNNLLEDAVRESFLVQTQPGTSPKQLIISLNRFKYFPSRKSSKQITVDQQITLPFYVTARLDRAMDTQYQLKAAIAHDGSLNGGHYVAFTWEKNEILYHNDDHVSVATPAQLTWLNGNGYVFFYEKTN